MEVQGDLLKGRDPPLCLKGLLNHICNVRLNLLNYQ